MKRRSSFYSLNKNPFIIAWRIIRKLLVQTSDLLSVSLPFVILILHKWIANAVRLHRSFPSSVTCEARLFFALKIYYWWCGIILIFTGWMVENCQFTKDVYCASEMATIPEEAIYDLGFLDFLLFPSKNEGNPSRNTQVTIRQCHSYRLNSVTC